MAKKSPRKELHRAWQQAHDGRDNLSRWRRQFRMAVARKIAALGFDCEALDLERRCTCMSVAAGDRIQNPGDLTPSLGLVVSGNVITCLRTPRRLIAQLAGPGNVVCLPTALAPHAANEFVTEAFDDAVIVF